MTAFSFPEATVFRIFCAHFSELILRESALVAYTVTVSSEVAGSDEIDASPEIVLDRPFVYLIRAGETGLVLFAGMVNNPNVRS
jgi:serine protease inhibitor